MSKLQSRKNLPPSPIYLVPAADAIAGAPRLGESQRQFTSAFEDSAVGMALIAPDSRRLRVNKAFCDMLGYTEAQMLARTVHDITHPDDVAEDLLQRAAILAGEKDSYQREKRYIHKSGRILWGHSSWALVRDARGEPLHFIAQVQDITERKLAEQALRTSEERFRSLTLLSSDWYWEQDESLRFTAFSGSRQAGPWQADQKTAIGRCRWDIEGVFPINTTWALHRAALEACSRDSAIAARRSISN